MNDHKKSAMEVQAYRHMAVMRFSSMVLFSALIKTHFSGRSKEELDEFLNLTHEYIQLIEKNAGEDPTMKGLIPSIEAFIDDIVSTAGISM